jgi:outer membrane protein OmpA-like peptidoglycan-associated protein
MVEYLPRYTEEGSVRRVLIATALAAVLTAAIAPWGHASAQGNPTVQQTIDALKLKSGASRGSRPVVAPPASDAAPAAAPRVAAPTAAAAPVVQAAATRATAPAAAAAADAPAIDFNVLFASGSADLTPAATKTLDTIGQALTSTDLVASRFRIEGHTDTVGTREGNQALSARRAEKVVQYLTEKFAIQPTRLEAKGMGEEHLVVPTGDQVNEPRNRRVRIVNITG